MAQLNTVPLLERILVTNEQVTKIPARELVHRTLDENTNKPQNTRNVVEILDNACGSGVVRTELLKYSQENAWSCGYKRIVNADIDPSMTDHIRKHLGEWDTETEIMNFDQQAVPLRDESFTHITNNFGIFFVADDHAALKETFRLLKPGGTAGFTSWKKITWFHTLAVPALEKHIPEIVQLLPDPLAIFPSKGWHDRETVKAKLRDVGFEDVEVKIFPFALEVEHAPFAEATAFLIKALMRIAWSKEQYEKYEGKIEPAFLKYLAEEFSDGYWEGEMKALVTTGKKPAVVEDDSS